MGTSIITILNIPRVRLRVVNKSNMSLKHCPYIARAIMNTVVSIIITFLITIRIALTTKTIIKIDKHWHVIVIGSFV